MNRNLPPYQCFPVIPNGSVALRAVMPNDIPAIIPISFYDAKPANSVEEAATMQEKINADYANGNSIHWAIEDLATHKIVGTCGYYRGFANNAGELGCVLLPPFQGRGFMTTAMQLAIDFGLRAMRLQRIFAITSPQNTKAIQLLERLGFSQVARHANDEIEYQLTHNI